MPFKEKPYDQCITCQYLGERCDGPNFLAMSTERWCEWCRLRKDYLNLSNADVADRSGVSKVSTDRIMAGSCGDIRVSTMMQVTKALVNGSWGQHPCANPEPEIVYQDNPVLVQELSELHDERKRLRDALDRKEQEHAAAMEKMEKYTEKRLDYLKKIIRALAIIAAFFGLLVVTALIVDMLNHNVGFFWLNP